MAEFKYEKPVKGATPTAAEKATKPFGGKKKKNKDVMADGPNNFLKQSTKRVVEAGANNFLKPKKKKDQGRGSASPVGGGFGSSGGAQIG